jgi:putative hemolysin
MEIIVLSVLVLLNGFFALSEIALVSSKKSRLEQLRVSGSKGAAVALKLQNNSENFLSAIQVGITLIGIVTGVYGGMNLADDLTPYVSQYDFLRAYAPEIALTITVVLITYVSIVLGELVPKTLALSNPEKIAIKVAPVVYYFSGAFYPFVKALSLSTNFINKLLGIGKYTEQVTEAELRQMLKMASTDGVIEKEQNLLHEKVFYFSDKKAKHIMTHRTEVDWIDIDCSHDEILQQISEVQHSKIICCKGDLDDFQGLLYMKDYYKALTQGKTVDIADVLVAPTVVPENSSAQKVLNILRQKNTHICCVVNEYGGFEGIITLHDIIENLIGHMPEEGDDAEPDVFVRDDKSVLVSGDAPVETLVDLIDGFTIDFEDIDYSTVAGFVFSQIGKMPQVGDKFIYLGHKIEIVDMDGMRVDKILITKEK